MSKPAFVPERREIWYSDGATGFYALRVAENVWPTGAPAGCLSRKLSVSAGGVGKIRVGTTRDGGAESGRRIARQDDEALAALLRQGRRERARGAFNSRRRVTAVFSTAKKHRGKGVSPGARKKSAAKRFKRSVRLRKSLTVLYRGKLAAGMKGSRVRFIGAVDGKRWRSAKALRTELRNVGL